MPTDARAHPHTPACLRHAPAPWTLHPPGWACSAVARTHLLLHARCSPAACPARPPARTSCARHAQSCTTHALLHPAEHNWPLAPPSPPCLPSHPRHTTPHHATPRHAPHHCPTPVRLPLQGASKNVTYQEWEKLWSINKRIIDPVCPRHTAVETKGRVPVTLTNGPADPEVRRGAGACRCPPACRPSRPAPPTQVLHARCSSTQHPVPNELSPSAGPHLRMRPRAHTHHAPPACRW